MGKRDKKLDLHSNGCTASRTGVGSMSGDIQKD